MHYGYIATCRSVISGVIIQNVMKKMLMMKREGMVWGRHYEFLGFSKWRRGGMYTRHGVWGLGLRLRVL